MKNAGRSTAAAILLLCALSAALAALIIVPTFAKWNAYGKTIRENRATVDQIQADERDFARLTRAGGEWIDFARNDRAGFLKATTSEQARLNARDYITALIEGYQGSLSSIASTVEASSRERIELIHVEITARVPKSRLPVMMIAMEDEPPFILVESFTLSSSGSDEAAIRLKGTMQRFEGVER